MDIHQQIPLKNYTTIKLGGPARFFSEIHTPGELQTIYASARAQNLPIFILGGGSNLVVKDEGFQGIVLHIRIPGFEVINDDLNSVTIKIGAGEVWDSVVERAVKMNLSGIEAMSGIPGSTGGTPVTNVGAYGQEIADSLESLEAFDTTTQQFVTLPSELCGFSYRHSAFRGEVMGRYIITSLTLRLSKNMPMPPFYDALQSYLDEHQVSLYTPQTIREAVLAIRSKKLPDPSVKPNAGSFFKNAVIDQWLWEELIRSFPSMPHFDMPDNKVKIPSGWLIEQAGFKGQLLHGIRIHEDNALVLVNESAQTYQDLAAAREEIRRKVKDLFRIDLEQEPLEV